MQFDRFALDQPGTVLAHSVKADDIAFRKGRRLSAADLDLLAAAGVESVVAVRFGPGDVPEDEAAGRLAALIAGAGSIAAPALTGRPTCCRRARRAGAGSATDRSVQRDRRIGDAGDTAGLCGGRAAADAGHRQDHPVLAARRPCGALLRRAADGPLVRVAPFRPWRARLIQTELPSVAAKVLDKTVRITRDRVEAVGGELLGRPAARMSRHRWRSSFGAPMPTGSTCC